MNKKRILILETKTAISNVLVSILKDEGYRCKVRNTTQELENIIVQFRPCGILICRRIPDLGVVKAIELIRSIPYGRQAAILHITGTGSEHAEAMKAGANYTLYKPIDITKLLFTLENFTNLN